MIELPGYSVLVDNAVFAEELLGEAKSGVLIVLNKVSNLSVSDVFNYLREKSSEVSSMVSADPKYGPATELEKLLLELPEAYHNGLSGKPSNFFEKNHFCIHGHMADLNSQYIEIEYWKLSDEEIKKINDDPDYLKQVFAKDDAENGFGKKWRLLLKVDEEGFLPDEDLIFDYLEDRVSYSRTLLITDVNYSRREVQKVIEILFTSWQPEYFDDLNDNTKKRLEDLAISSLEDTLSVIKED